jgi:hypothetical protein
VEKIVEKPTPTRPPDPDRQEGGEHQIFRARRDGPSDVLPPADSLAGRGELIAPTGRYRLVGVDTFEGPFADFLVGDFDNREDAIAEAAARAGRLQPFYVYNDRGELVFSAGQAVSILTGSETQPGEPRRGPTLNR